MHSKWITPAVWIQIIAIAWGVTMVKKGESGGDELNGLRGMVENTL